MRISFLSVIVIVSFFCAFGCSENKKKLTVQTPFLNKIEIDQFDNIKIESLFKMKDIQIKDNSDHHLEYGKMDYSYIRKTLPVVNDMIFLEVDSKDPIDLEELKKRMSQLDIKGPRIDLENTNNLTWAWRWKSNNQGPDFGCVLTYYDDTGRISLEWRQMTREWFLEVLYYYREIRELPMYNLRTYELIETFE